MALTATQETRLAERACTLRPIAGDLPATPDPARDLARAVVCALRALVGFEPADRAMFAAGLEVARQYAPAEHRAALERVRVDLLVDVMVEQERQAYGVAAWAARNPERAGVDGRVARREARRRSRTLSRIRHAVAPRPVLAAARPVRAARSTLGRRTSAGQRRTRSASGAGSRDDGGGEPEPPPPARLPAEVEPAPRPLVIGGAR